MMVNSDVFIALVGHLAGAQWTKITYSSISTPTCQKSCSVRRWMCVSVTRFSLPKSLIQHNECFQATLDHDLSQTLKLLISQLEGFLKRPSSADYHLGFQSSSSLMVTVLTPHTVCVQAILPFTWSALLWPLASTVFCTRSVSLHTRGVSVLLYTLTGSE